MYIPQVQSNTPFQDIQIDDSKVNRMIWGTVEDYVITGHENGQICQYDWKTGTVYKYLIAFLIDV